MTSLTRGARFYDMTDNLDANINYAEALIKYFKQPGGNFLPNRTAALDISITSGSINLRDQIRKDGDMPLQFSYEAADCRIYYTPSTVWNYTALWQYAADAIWTNPKLCVEGSTGYAKTNTTKTAAPADTALVSANAPAVQASESQLGEIIMSMISSSDNLGETGTASGGLDYSASAIADFENKPCPTKPKKGCPPSTFHCLETFTACSKDGKEIPNTPSCVLLCNMNNKAMCESNKCQPLVPKASTAPKNAVDKRRGYCVPPPPSCKRNTGITVSNSDSPPPPSKTKNYKRGVLLPGAA